MFEKLAGLFSRKRPEREAVAPVVLLDAGRRRSLLEEANMALNKRDYSLLETLLDALLRSNPKDPEAVTLDGLRLFVHGNHEAAVSVLRAAIEYGTTDFRAQKFLPESLLQLGRIDEGLAAGGPALGKFPNDPQVLYVCGMLFLRAQDLEQAAFYLNRSLETAPRELALLVLTNLLSVEVQGRVILRKDLVSDKARHTRKRLFRQLASASRAGAALSVIERMALMALGLNAEHFALAWEQAMNIHAQPLVELEDAAYGGYVFMMGGDARRALDMWEQLGHRLNAVQQYSVGIVLAASAPSAWASGWQMMSEGWASKLRHKIFRRGLPVWRGERLGAKKLLVYQDQGFGDLLIALRFLKRLHERGIRVVLTSLFDIQDMVAESLPGLEVVWSPEGSPTTDTLGCSAAVALFDLVHVLRMPLEELRHPVSIRAPAGLCADWTARLENVSCPRVGFVLSGNPWRQDDWIRSVSHEEAGPLARLKDIVWVNLGVDERDDRAAMQSLFGGMDPKADLTGFAQTAAVIESLDVVVAIDCSVAHLAAALGKKVLVLAPTVVDWRWRVGEINSPFWPTVEVFHAAKPGQWKEPIERLAARLAELAEPIRARRQTLCVS